MNLKIFIEEGEYKLLQSLLEKTQPHPDKTLRESVEKFQKSLKWAKILPKDKMPEQAIRLNSVVTIQTPWKVQSHYQIVLPENSDIRKNKISILAPLSLSLFGSVKGGEFNWQYPVGMKTVKILEVVNSQSQLKTRTAC